MKKFFAAVLILILACASLYAFYSFSLANTSPSTTMSLQNSTSVSSCQPNWVIQIDGLVEHPYNLTDTELRQFPTITVNASLQCVGGVGGGPGYPDIAAWTGVNLKVLLDKAGGVKPGAMKVAFTASDGFTTDLSIQTALKDDIILAYQRNGEDLHDNRLVVPNELGYKWIHTVIHIEVVDYDFKGTYESQGYSD